MESIAAAEIGSDWSHTALRGGEGPDIPNSLFPKSDLTGPVHPLLQKLKTGWQKGSWKESEKDGEDDVLNSVIVRPPDYYKDAYLWTLPGQLIYTQILKHMLMYFAYDA